MQSYIKCYWYKMPCGMTIPADSPENVACLPGWSQSGVFSRVVSLSNDCIRRYFLALSRVLKEVSSLNIHLFISSSGSLVHKVRLHQSVSSASQIIMRRKLPEPFWHKSMFPAYSCVPHHYWIIPNCQSCHVTDCLHYNRNYVRGFHHTLPIMLITVIHVKCITNCIWHFI